MMDSKRKPENLSSREATPPSAPEKEELVGYHNTAKQLLINAKDAAGSLAISPRKLWELTNCGDIPRVRIGTRVLYDPRDLQEYIDKQKQR